MQSAYYHVAADALRATAVAFVGIVGLAGANTTQIDAWVALCLSVIIIVASVRGIMIELIPSSFAQFQTLYHNAATKDQPSPRNIPIIAQTKSEDNYVLQ